MRVVLFMMVVLIAFATLGSCTNDEGANDIDVLTPVDSTSSLQHEARK